MELYAGFGKSVYTAFATIGGNAVGVVATGKQLCHNCVAKASRFVRLCDAFSVPVVTIVDTEGFVPSVTDDVAGGIRNAGHKIVLQYKFPGMFSIQEKSPIMILQHLS